MVHGLVMPIYAGTMMVGVNDVTDVFINNYWISSSVTNV